MVAIISHLDLGVMRDGWLSVLSWHNNFPDTEWVSLHWHVLSVPFIFLWLADILYAHTHGERLTEITNKECLCRIWSPFAVCDVVVLVDIEAELLDSLVAVVSIRPSFM